MKVLYVIKRDSARKIKTVIINSPFCHSTLALLMQNTKEAILKKVSTIFVHTMKVIGIQNNTGPHWLSLYRQKKK